MKRAALFLIVVVAGLLKPVFLDAGEQFSNREAIAAKARYEIEIRSARWRYRIALEAALKQAKTMGDLAEVARLTKAVENLSAEIAAAALPDLSGKWICEAPDGRKFGCTIIQAKRALVIRFDNGSERAGELVSDESLVIHATAEKREVRATVSRTADTLALSNGDRWSR